MTEYVVAHFMPHDEEHFPVVELGKQSIPENNPLGAADAGHVGIDRLGVLAFLDFVNPAALDAGPAGQRENFSLQVLVLHVTEFVEERIDPDRRDQDDEEQERHGQDTRVEPPAPGTFLEQEIGNPEKEAAGNEVHRQTEKRITKPLAKRLVGEVIGMGTDVAAIVAQGQIDQVIEDRKKNEINADDKEPTPAEAL